ncbi:MAG: alkaline phosphatase [Sandaracinobacteroides sp.]
MKPLFAISLLAASPLLAQPIETPAASEPSWAKAAAEVAARSKVPGANARARNIILFIGDGMGITTVTAARIFEAQQRAKASRGSYPGFEGGEENLLAFERFPATALIKTYNSNAQVPDSAGTASAMTTGTKTRIGVLGLNPGQGVEACKTPSAVPKTLGELARARGMGVGVVTTTRITHATPAALYAHSPFRDWEGADKSYPAAARASGCVDIASQLIAFKGGLDVVLGGGLDHFRPADQDPATFGTRDDGRDLVSEWQKANISGRFVETAEPFRALDPKARGPVLGLFSASHMDYNADADRTRQPSLAEMASFAVRKLQARSGKKGFVLMVEGGRIDHAHHATNAYRALDETVEFAKAVEAVSKLVDPKTTLILVTADHSHVFTMAGYPPRGNDITGYIRPLEGGEGRVKIDSNGNVTDNNGRAMPTLSYANGPDRNFVMETGQGTRTLSADKPATDRDFLSPKTFALGSETHGGDDVALYATGPGSALVSGTLEQNSIFHIMAKALGWR